MVGEQCEVVKGGVKNSPELGVGKSDGHRTTPMFLRSRCSPISILERAKLAVLTKQRVTVAHHRSSQSCSRTCSTCRTRIAIPTLARYDCGNLKVDVLRTLAKIPGSVEILEAVLGRDVFDPCAAACSLCPTTGAATAPGPSDQSRTNRRTIPSRYARPAYRHCAKRRPYYVQAEVSGQDSTIQVFSP